MSQAKKKAELLIWPNLIFRIKTFGTAIPFTERKKVAILFYFIMKEEVINGGDKTGRKASWFRSAMHRP